MKKNKVKTTLSLIIIMVLCLSVGVYAAYVLSATEVSYTKSDGTTVSVKDALDELYGKAISREIGDEVSVGGEKFYVLEWDNNSDTVRLIAKHNLSSGGTRQSSSGGYDSPIFSSTNYWSNIFSSDPYNLNYLSGYESSDAMGKAKSYGASKGAVSSGLLTYQEAAKLKSKAGSNFKIETMLWGIDSGKRYLCYWLGSAETKNYVWTAYGWNQALISYYHADDNDREIGVRPVITISKSLIQE